MAKTKTKPTPKGKKSPESQALAKPPRGKLESPMKRMLDDVGGGFENADVDSYAIPFITVLQKNSPQCDDGDDRFIDKARPGMLYNTATGEVYSGSSGVLIVPAYFRRRLVEWIPRDQGGGFRGSYGVDEIDLAKLKRDENSGRFLLDNGNELRDTRYHFCLLLGDEAPEFVVLALTSTQIKKSRQWMTRLRMLKVQDDKGVNVTPPTYGSVWRATTVGEENKKGSWRGWKIEFDHFLGENKKDVNLFKAAKEFRVQVRDNKAHLDESVLAGDADDTVLGDDGEY